MTANLLGRLLLDDGCLNAGQLDELNRRCLETGKTFLSAALEEIGFETVSGLLARLGLVESCDLGECAFSQETVKLLGYSAAARYNALPVKREGDRLFVAVGDPFCEKTLADLRDLTGLFIEPLLAREADIRFYVNRVFGTDRIDSITSQFVTDERIKKNPYQFDLGVWEQLQNAPAVRLIDSLIESAALYRASDIHIEPSEDIVRARYRIDGFLSTYQQVSVSMLPYVISRLKVMGGLNIAEKRLPQDGHFKLTLHGEEIDFRLSTLPTVYGEKAVIRLLYKQTGRLKKQDLGFFPEDLEILSRLFHSAYGAVFMTGPTGSGKSTTLNCFLEELSAEAVNIVTVEDPVENPLPGINHINVAPAAGLGFANILRHILRQDPDIIMIGEIRDEETARIAVQAAITGHLVLSTLHTNDAAGVFERLVNMGVEPYLVAASLNGIISQRLVRRICPFCKVPRPLTVDEAHWLRVPPDTPSYAGAGCPRCNQTGYRGRLALYEYIVMDEKLRKQLTDAAHGSILLREQGSGMLSNGIRHICEGHTTPSEVLRTLLAK